MKKKVLISLISMVSAATISFSSVQAFAVDNNKSKEMNSTFNLAESEMEESKNNLEEAKVDENYVDVKDYAKTISKQIIDTTETTGIQYAVMYDGQIILSDNAGLANKKDDKEINNDTIFGIGSVSKMFVAVSVMKLVDEGKVDLDKPVVDYIPEFQMADDRYKKITVRMLLNHSSGLMGTVYSNTILYDDNDTIGYDNLLDELKKQRLKSEPGEYSVYCNDGFSLAQLLVEKVSGDDFTTYIHENFTDKLNMDNTKTIKDEFDYNDLCKAYSSDGKELLRDSVNFIGAGGVYSTAEDLCKFLQCFNNDDILTEESRNDMMQNEAQKGVYPNNSEDMLKFGLGWDDVRSYDLNRYNIIGTVKMGDTYEYHGAVINIPQHKMSIAVLSAGGTGTIDELVGTAIAKMVLKDKGIISEILPDSEFDKLEKSSMDPNLKEYSGLYSVSGTYINVDIKDNGELEMYSKGNEDKKQVYHYTSDGYFTDEKNISKIKPIKESNGKVYLRVKGYTSIPNAAQVMIDEYQMQKIEVNTIPLPVQKAWDERKDNEYLLLNEKYTSQVYKVGKAVTKLNFDNNAYGYVNGLRIVNENKAENVIEIPGLYGRDTSDMNFYNNENNEYMKVGSYLFISSKNVNNLSLDMKNIKIDKDGYGKWFKISNLKGQKLNVEMSDNCGFAVYNEKNECINDSVVSGDNSVDLENGKYILFMGDKGKEFNLSFSK